MKTDDELAALFARDVDRAWRAFVDAYTPTIVALIERAGVRDRDETMDVYTLVCERLAADGCARLRRRDPTRGTMAAWLAVVVRNTMVDWVRSRAGRRRLFGAIQQLDAFHQQVFQAYYWNDLMPSEIAEELSVAQGRPVSLFDVLLGLDTIHSVMSERHYAELLSMTARSRPPVSLETALEERRIDPAAPAVAITPDVDAAVCALPAEDAAIVRLHYFQGLSLDDVRRALHLPELSRGRLTRIVAALKTQLTTSGTEGHVS